MAEYDKRINTAAWNAIRAVFNLLWFLLRVTFARIMFAPVTAALILLILGVVIILYGFFTLYAVDQRTWEQFVADLYANGGAELLSIAITVLIIDTLNKRRSTLERKSELKLQMSSTDNSFAVEAARLLRLKGWLRDGTLKYVRLEGANLARADLGSANLMKADLKNANLHETTLQEANLSGANLSGATLYHANLEGANLYEANLDKAKFNKNTILPDGSNWTSDTEMSKYTHTDK